jgi:hypothetical protein
MLSDEELKIVLKQALLQEYPEKTVNSWFLDFYSYDQYLLNLGGTWEVYRRFVLDKQDKKPRRIINV